MLKQPQHAQPQAASNPNSGRVLAEFAEQLADFDVDKSTLRFQPGTPPTDEMIEHIVAARRAEIDRR